MDVDARLEALEAELARAYDQIDYLKGEMIDPVWRAPACLRLTPHESLVLGALMRRDVCTKQQLLVSVYVHRADEPPEIKVIDVFVCKMRRKLKPFDITVRTLWGVGYSLDLENRQRVKAMIEAESTARAA